VEAAPLLPAHGDVVPFQISSSRQGGEEENPIVDTTTNPRGQELTRRAVLAGASAAAMVGTLGLPVSPAEADVPRTSRATSGGGPARIDLHAHFVPALHLYPQLAARL
jgi:hypothetical protein